MVQFRRLPLTRCPGCRAMLGEFDAAALVPHSSTVKNEAEKVVYQVCWKCRGRVAYERDFIHYTDKAVTAWIEMDGELESLKRMRAQAAAVRKVDGVMIDGREVYIRALTEDEMLGPFFSACKNWVETTMRAAAMGLCTIDGLPMYADPASTLAIVAELPVNDVQAIGVAVVSATEHVIKGMEQRKHAGISGVDAKL